MLLKPIHCTMMYLLMRNGKLHKPISGVLIKRVKYFDLSLRSSKHRTEHLMCDSIELNSACIRDDNDGDDSDDGGDDDYDDEENDAMMKFHTRTTECEPKKDVVSARGKSKSKSSSSSSNIRCHSLIFPHHFCAVSVALLVAWCTLFST